MTLATIVSTGPIAARTLLITPITTFILVERFAHSSMSCLILGITVSLRKLTTFVIIGASAVASSVLKERNACFKAYISFPSLPVISASSSETIPTFSASSIHASSSSSEALKTGLSKVPNLSPKNWFAKAVLVAASSTPAIALLIFLKAASASRPAKSSIVRPIFASSSETSSPLAILPKRLFTFWNALSKYSVSLPSCLAAYSHF